MAHLARNIQFQRTLLPSFALSLLVLSSSLSFYFCQSVFLNYFFTLFSSDSVTSVFQLLPLSHFSFLLIFSLFLTFNVCVHILILTSILCFESFHLKCQSSIFSLSSQNSANFSSCLLYVSLYALWSRNCFYLHSSSATLPSAFLPSSHSLHKHTPKARDWVALFLKYILDVHVRGVKVTCILW